MNDLPRTANKGEWAELYVFFKIALERVVHAADKDLRPKPDEYYEFIKLFRRNNELGMMIYDLRDEDSVSVLESTNGKPIEVIMKDTLRDKTRRIFERIQAASSTFAVEDAAGLMDEYRLTSVKAPSSSKTDIDGYVKASNSPTAHDMGFSIKSYIGSPPTLVNSSLHTNFIYRVEGFTGDISEINAIDTRSKVRDRIASIKEHGGRVVFDSMQSDTYKTNLRMHDSNYPAIMARMLRYFYEGNGYDFDKLVDMASSDNDLDVTREEACYKTKGFLRSSALGMVPATLWDTRLAVLGGYIVLLETGELLCYSLYYDDDFRDYLYANTRFDTPSTTKYDYGYLYENNGTLYIKLNLQIRFKKA